MIGRRKRRGDPGYRLREGRLDGACAVTGHVRISEDPDE
jgi:hypothetical protein